MLSIVNDFLKFLNNKFEGEVPNLLYFAIGIGIGIILFLVFLIIFIIIYKIKNKTKSSPENVEIIVKEEYKDIINNYVCLYNEKYVNASFKEKFIGTGKIVLSMMNEISSLYYPDSDDPMFEISIDQLIDFLSYLTYRINYTIDGILQGKLSFIEKVTKKDIKNMKLSIVFEIIDKGKKIASINKDKPKKDNLFNKLTGKLLKKGKELIVGIGQNATNDEIINLIPSLGEDINKLYSKQELVFKDVSKKQLKEYKRQLRLSLKKGRDNND